MAEEPDWDQGIPLGILSAVAGGRDELKAMRGVNHTWQTGFEESVKCIKIERAGPLLPLDGDSFAERFPALISLNLGGSLIIEGSRPKLSRIRKLTHLTLGIVTCPLNGNVEPELEATRTLASRLTDAGMEAIRGLPLKSLSLSECRNLSDAGLMTLQGMPLARLVLRFCDLISGSGLVSLRDMPLRSLVLAGAKI